MEDLSQSPDRFGMVGFIRNDTSDALVLDVVGDLDALCAEAFEDYLVQCVRLGRTTIANLRDVKMLDASCLSVLVRARNALGSRLIVYAPKGGVVERVLALNGFVPAAPLPATVALRFHG